MIVCLILTPQFWIFNFMNVDLILKYFPKLNDQQIDLFTKMNDLYQDWNLKINVVSRKDVELLYERHILHSLGIAKIIQFKSGASVMDLGTGGGFPGIPLAIMFPETEFYLVDSIGKKIKVVQEVVQGLGIKNVRASQARAEEIAEEFDFVVSRAVAPLDTLVYWTQKKYFKMWNHSLKNGLICLKGGELADELAPYQKKVKIWDLKDYFEEEFFETKKVVYLPMI
jgi:16S rRNA (guanine527-N7)-methyltransferase